MSGKSYKSENLIVLNDVAETAKNGITYSIKNGVITLNGTSTNNINLFEISVKRNKGIEELNNKLVEIFDSDTFNERFKFID